MTLCRFLHAASIVLLIAAIDASAKVDAPRRWNDVMLDDTRIVSNEVSTVQIGPWESLGSQTVREWIKDRDRRAPVGGELVSIEKIYKEKVPGAYSIMRAARYDGNKGRSILYACPDVNNRVRLMTLDVRDGNLLDVIRGAKFGEDACRDYRSKYNVVANPSREQPATSNAPAESRVSQSHRSGKSAGLAKLNANIPPGGRPTSAYTSLSKSWRGFPAQLVYKAEMKLKFPNGNIVGCADWDPTKLSPTSTSVGRAIEDCEVTTQPPEGKALNGFAPGQTIDLKFGNISGDSFPAGGTLRRSDLIMTSGGRIGIGSFTVNTTGDSGNSATSIRRSKSLSGRYYLDGHTITIVSEDGETLHGFIAYKSDNNSRKADHIYVNGEHFWDRKK